MQLFVTLLRLASDDVSGDTVVPLVYVKFQRVESITVSGSDGVRSEGVSMVEW